MHSTHTKSCCFFFFEEKLLILIICHNYLYRYCSGLNIYNQHFSRLDRTDQRWIAIYISLPKAQHFVLDMPTANI